MPTHPLGQNPALPLTREQLDTMRCETPGCECGGGRILKPACHPAGRLEIWYADGVVHVTCLECRSLVTRIAVASVFDRADGTTRH
jgi:Zn ribbon nucleic-acid-binding protein